MFDDSLLAAALGFAFRLFFGFLLEAVTFRWLWGSMVDHPLRDQSGAAQAGWVVRVALHLTLLGGVAFGVWRLIAG